MALACQQNIGIGFIIPQQDVVLGLMLLDQIVFEDQRLGFGMGNRKLDMMDMADQGPSFGTPRVTSKIGAQAFHQILGFTHIQNDSVLTQHPVNARLMRDRGKERFMIKRHLNICSHWNMKKAAKATLLCCNTRHYRD
jgi:hypothetical protein